MNSGYEEIEDDDLYGKESTITVVNQYGTYIIELNREPEDIYDFVESQVKPVLLAMGYSANNVAEVFNDVETQGDVFVPTVWQSPAGYDQVTTFTSTSPAYAVGTKFVCLKDVAGCIAGEMFVLTDQGDNAVEAVSSLDRGSVTFPVIVGDQDNITKDELREIFNYELRDFVQIVD